MEFKHKVKFRGLREGVGVKSGNAYTMVKLAWFGGTSEFFVDDVLASELGQLALGEDILAEFEVESSKRVNLCGFAQVKAGAPVTK